MAEYLRPEPRLEVVFRLRQVEVRTRAAGLQRRMVVEQVQPEVHERAGHRLAIHLEVLLEKVPAAWPDDQRRDPVLELVMLALGTGELDAAVNRIPQVDLPADHVEPVRRH